MAVRNALVDRRSAATYYHRRATHSRLSVRSRRQVRNRLERGRWGAQHEQRAATVGGGSARADGAPEREAVQAALAEAQGRAPTIRSLRNDVMCSPAAVAIQPPLPDGGRSQRCCRIGHAHAATTDGTTHVRSALLLFDHGLTLVSIPPALVH
jgi:hypothetical protein